MESSWYQVLLEAATFPIGAPEVLAVLQALVVAVGALALWDAVRKRRVTPWGIAATLFGIMGLAVDGFSTPPGPPLTPGDLALMLGLLLLFIELLLDPSPPSK